jgi:hypothetical protein
VKPLIRRRASATLESRATLEPKDTDLALIARFVPAGFPVPTAADVYCVSALICNNLVDHYSTQFTDAALGEIVALIPGTNIMRNHDEYSLEALPIGRCYAAELVTLPDGLYVRAYWYWERGTSDGDDMARRIALGLWREMSLSWWMSSFTNSIDGKPMDESPYYPGQEFEGVTVIGMMADVEEVNEVSIVARGGQKNTSIGPSRDDAGVMSVEGLMTAARARAKARPASGLARYFPARPGVQAAGA